MKIFSLLTFTMDIYERIEAYKKEYRFSHKHMGALIGKSADAFRMAVKRKSLGELEIEKLEKIFSQNRTSHSALNEESETYKPEGKIIDDKELPEKEVFVIPIKGRGGLENAFYDDLAINELETEKLSIKYPSSKGSKWFKIEVEGVSMDDSTSDSDGSKYSLAEGDWAYCRSIPKMHWKNKLHINTTKVFCFFHNTRGILFKKVKSHNIETGELVLTSLNADKENFPDFTINVGECSYICNVIKVLTDF
tara:strand:+ start:129 stop:878 length:750 start_codon:yes stop_codon:yes gene_type:complete